LACGDQRRLTGSGSALEVVLHDYALYKSTFTYYCRCDFSRTRQGQAITRYASFVAFNKAYSTNVNKRVHCVRAGQFTTRRRHTRDDCKLGGWEPRLACCVCSNYQQAMNTRATPHFLLQPMQYSPVCGHTGSQCFDEGNCGNWADRWFHGTRVGTRVGHTEPGYPSTRVLTSLITSPEMFRYSMACSRT